MFCFKICFVSGFSKKNRLDIKKFKILLCTSVYHEGNLSPRDFKNQDITPSENRKFNCLIPGNSYVQNECMVKP